MKILFIVPTIKQLSLKRNLHPIGSKIFRVPFLGVLTAASCVPSKHQVTVIDEHIEMVNYNTDCDLIGITVATSTAKRAYVIADEFRKRNKKIFMGGFHVTFNPEEALNHADSVVIGDAEGNIQELLSDFENRRLREKYERKDLCDPGEIPVIKRELIRFPQHYFTTNVIQATRGCIYKCDFCGVRLFNRDTFRKRPIEAVIAELSKLKGKKVLFTDDNLIGDIEYAKELFLRMIPLKKWWMGQMSINCHVDVKLLRLAAQSGCFGVFIGFETINARNLAAQSKLQNVRTDYKYVIARLHKFGIAVAGGTMFGFDYDGRETFNRTVNYFLNAKLDCIQVDPVTAFPGTPLFKQFKAQERLITYDWEKFNIAEVTFKPKSMSPQELQAGLDYVRRMFYTFPRLLQRFFRTLRGRGLMAALIIACLNWGYWRHLKKNIGYPP